MALYSVSEVADEVGLSEQDLRALIRAGSVPAEKVSGVWILDDDGLDAAREVVEEVEEEEDAEENPGDEEDFEEEDEEEVEDDD